MLEDKRVVDIYGLADLVVHCVNICLVHSHALLGQGRSIIDGDVMELWVILPVLVCKRTLNPILQTSMSDNGIKRIQITKVITIRGNPVLNINLNIEVNNIDTHYHIFSIRESNMTSNPR